MKSKTLSLIGLAHRAGELVLGESNVLNIIKTSQIKLIFLASDAGINIKKKIRNKCQTYQISLIESYSKDQLLNAIGKPRLVIGVKNEGFKKALLKTYKQEERGGFDG